MPGSNADMDSTEKPKSFGRVIERFAEKTSMQGVPYINMAKLWWAKVIWTVLLLCAIGAMTLHLWFLFDQYYQYPKQTDITLGFKSLSLPQVTICNTNVIHKSRLVEFEGQEDLKYLIEELSPNKLVPEYFDGFTTTQPSAGGTTTDPSVNTAPPPPVRRRRGLSEYDDINATKYIDDFYEESVEEDDFDGEMDRYTLLEEIFVDLYMDIEKGNRSYLGHQISDMLIRCTFNGRTCDSKMFKLHQTAEYGNCWTIDDEKFNVKTPGPKGGLSLVLFLETNDYLRGLTTGFGTRVVIQEKNTYPFPSHEGMFIPASMETNIGLKMTSITRLGGKFGKCDDGKTFKDNHKLTYTRRACQSFCLVTTVIKTCNCFDETSEEYAITKNPQLRPCRSREELKCSENIWRESQEKELCECEKPCSEITYLKTLSMRQWPSDDYAKVLLDWVCEKDTDTCNNLKENITSKYLNNNFLKLNIYYEDLNFENITEKAQIEIQQFLSDVGGAVGLWIGLSILSLCEVLQLFVELIVFAVHKSRNKTPSDGNGRKDNSGSNNMRNDDRRHQGDDITKRPYLPPPQSDRYSNPERDYFGPKFIPRPSTHNDPRDERFRDDRHLEPRDDNFREPRDSRRGLSRDNSPFTSPYDRHYNNYRNH